MKICITKLGRFAVELSNGTIFELHEDKGLLYITTLRDLESGDRPNLIINGEYSHNPQTHIRYANNDIENYKQGEFE